MDCSIVSKYSKINYSSKDTTKDTQWVDFFYFYKKDELLQTKIDSTTDI